MTKKETEVNDTLDGIDRAMQSLLSEPIPIIDEKRLQMRFAEFEARLAQSGSAPLPKRVVTRRVFHWATAASAAAIAGATLSLWNSTAPPALADPPVWDEVASAVESRPWMHMVGRHPRGTKIQFWVSVSQGIFAMRAGDAEPEFAAYDSQQADARWSWRNPSNNIRKEAFRLPPGELGHLGVLLSAFKSGKTRLELPGQVSILSQSRKTVERKGERIWQYIFTLKAMDEGHADTYVVVFEVEPETRLPRTWTRRSPDGGRQLKFGIEYQESGPEDIYSLGVPRSAEVIDVSDADDRSGAS